MRSMSARRVAASFCSPTNDQWCCVSAGIGATPVLSMLYALSEARSTRQVFWLHGTRDRQHHPFAAEVRRLMLALPNGRSYVCYSRPGAHDTAEDFNATGHLSRSVFEEVGVSRDADVYVCGPGRFMAEMKEALAAVGVAPERIHVELFNGSESMAPGVVAAADTSSASARGRGRHRSARVVRAQRHRRTLEGIVIREHSGVGRGVRRPGSVVVPDRCVSQLRERSRLGGGRLRTGATRQACRRQPPRLLLATASRRRHRFVKGLRPQMEDQGAADQTEANARRDERHQHGGREDRKDHKRSAPRQCRVRTGTCVASARANTSRSKTL